MRSHFSPPLLWEPHQSLHHLFSQSPPHPLAPLSFAKINFDGATKAKLGLTRFGGVIHDSQGYPMGIFTNFFKVTSNSVAETTGLEKFLLLSRRLGCSKIQIVWDSKNFIEMDQKIVDGSLACKLVHSWRLESQVVWINSLIDRFSYVITTHSLRLDNKVAY